MTRKNPPTRRPRGTRPTFETLEARDIPSIDLTGVDWRSITGAGNNLNPALVNQGAANTQQIRNGYGAQFPDTIGNVIIGPTTAGPSGVRPNARTVSNSVGAQVMDARDARGLTDWHTLWGQFITHDLGLTPNGPQFNGGGDFSIPVTDPNDPLGPNPIRFNRSQVADGTGVTTRREVVNAVTSYIDASTVYGSDAVREAALREFSGGRLKVSAGNLLPFNTPALPNDNPFGVPAGSLFLAGDVRANEQVGLASVHTLFVREHNRLAGLIAAQNPTFTDEQIYQTARRIVGAQMQIITYEEYLPAVLGFGQSVDPTGGTYDLDFFRPTVTVGGVTSPRVANSSTTNAFAHAGFRFAHSQINDLLFLVNNAGQQTGSLTLRDAFFNPAFLTGNPGNLDLVLKGQATQVAQAVDLMYADAVRNNLFRPGGGGTDLLSLDIQRGRDHGLPDYATLRRQYGAVVNITEAQLGPDDFHLISSDPAIQAKLRQISATEAFPNGNTNNLDPIVGILAEDHLPGSSAGPLLTRMLTDQFTRSRDGDRFFYTRDPFLQQPGVRSVIDLNSVTLANIIRWNTGVSNIQDNVFFEPSIVIVEAPTTGSNLSVVAAGGLLTVVDTQNNQLRAVRPLSAVSQVVLVGAPTAADRFNLFVASANGGIERGVLVVGGRANGVASGPNLASPPLDTPIDELNVFGRPFQRDVFFVSPASVTVNGNLIDFRQIERLRIVTLFGNDSVTVAPGMTIPVEQLSFFNPLNWGGGGMMMMAGDGGVGGKSASLSGAEAVSLSAGESFAAGSIAGADFLTLLGVEAEDPLAADPLFAGVSDDAMLAVEV